MTTENDNREAAWLAYAAEFAWSATACEIARRAFDAAWNAALPSRPSPATDEELVRAIGLIIAPLAFDPRMGSMSARAQKDGRAKAQQIIDLFASRPSSTPTPATDEAR